MGAATVEFFSKAGGVERWYLGYRFFPFAFGDKVKAILRGCPHE